MFKSFEHIFESFEHIDTQMFSFEHIDTWRNV